MTPEPQRVDWISIMNGPAASDGPVQKRPFGLMGVRPATESLEKNGGTATIGGALNVSARKFEVYGVISRDLPTGNFYAMTDAADIGMPKNTIRVAMVTSALRDWVINIKVIYAVCLLPSGKQETREGHGRGGTFAEAVANMVWPTEIP